MAKKKSVKKAIKKKSANKKSAPKKASRKVTQKTSVKKSSVSRKAVSKKAVARKIAKKESKTMAKSGSQASHTPAQMPDLTLPNSKGEMVSLQGLKGKKIVLYFYPKDDTPGCTLEGQEFSALYSQFQKLNTEVFGVSRDKVAAHDKFKCKYNFGFELLSDENEKLCKAFDVIKEKNMYGKMVLGIQRSTFIIDESGKVVVEYRKVSPPGHAAEVLEKIKAL